MDRSPSGFRALLRPGHLGQLCKRTRMECVLLADLMPDDNAVQRGKRQLAEVRYTAIDCASGQSSQSGWLRIEPVVRDRYSVQQSILMTGRRFVYESRDLLQKQQ